MRGSTANNDELVDSDNEQILTPTSSDGARWSRGAKSITQRDDEDPQAAGDAQNHKIGQGPEESAGAPADSDAMKEALVNSSAQSHHGSGEVVETIRDPAKLDTMKEAVAGSASAPRQGTALWIPQGHEAASNPLASTSTVSYVLGGNRPTVALASPAPPENVGKSAPKPPRPPKHDAADQSHPAPEPKVRASVPLMQAVRPAEAARRAQKPPRRTRRPADTRAQGQGTDDCCEEIAMPAFCCGMCVAFCIVWLLEPC